MLAARSRVAVNFAVAMLLATGSWAQDPPFPRPSRVGDPSVVGRGVQRTMTLLESSTADSRNTVRVLLYGQSITAGRWGVLLEEHLRKTYPHANLIYSRLPLSGFSTERLVRTAHADLYPAQADLVIFHDYGNHDDYETMVRELRRQTTAEVIIQSDHLRRSETWVDESSAKKIADAKQRRAEQRNSRFLPEVARKYGCAIDGRRELWKDYLREHRLVPGDLLKDDVHPNEHGTYLMTELIKAYLVPRDDITIDPMNCGYVTTYVVGEDIEPSADRLSLDFDGSRVDVIFARDAAAKLDVKIDGQNPLDDPQRMHHGRNRVKWRGTAIPPGPWPPVLQMGFAMPLVVEDWKLIATQDSEDPELYHFEVSGSVTGPDGSGSTDERFVSDSGRVVIEPADWDVRFSIMTLRRLDAMPREFQLDWSVVAEAMNVVSAPEAVPGVERAVTVAARLTDRRHELELSGDTSTVKAIRVYAPSKFPCPANQD